MDFLRRRGRLHRRKELEAIEDVDRADFDALRQLGFSTDGRAATQADQSTGAASTDGIGPSPAPDGTSEPESSPGEESAPAH